MGKVKTMNELLTQSEKSGWTDAQIQLMKDTICMDSTPNEFRIFLHAVKRTGLDPLMRQIYAVKRQGKMVIQVGIDGYRLIADRTGLYAGNDDPVYDNDKKPNKATVTVYKLIQGVRCPFTASARWDEYYPGKGLGFMWDKLPCLMLGKTAEALALRKAFPNELSGIYTDVEMEQAGKEDRRGVYPEQPTEMDGAPDLNPEYRIPGGKYAKKGLSEIPPHDLRDYIQYIESKIEKTPDKKVAWWDEFVKKAEEYLGDLENSIPAEVIPMAVEEDNFDNFIS